MSKEKTLETKYEVVIPFDNIEDARVCRAVNERFFAYEDAEVREVAV